MENNLPISSNNGESMIDRMKEDALMGFVEGILPKIQPFIEPAVKKMEDYFGDDNKIFLIRRSANQSVQVIVLDNTMGNYEISNSIDEQGSRDKHFSAHKKSVIAVYNVNEFISRLLSGEFTKK